MRDINRIEPFMNRVTEVWKQYPDLRFGQLILNTVSDPALYYIEDSDFLKLLEECYIQKER